MNGINNVTYCNNAQGSAISFSSPNAGVTYQWTSTADVGFGLGGNSSIGAFTTTNNTNSPVTATVSVTATGNGCTGAATTFTVTVNPTPVVSAVSNLNYCAGSPAGAINFSTPTTGGTVSYSWSSTIDVGFGLSGTGNIGAFTATNNSINPVTATVTVTPVLNGLQVHPFIHCYGYSKCSGYHHGLCESFMPAKYIQLPSTVQLATNGVTNGTSTWTSSNPTVATVSSSGLVTAVSGGPLQLRILLQPCGTSTSAP